eukprot:TRINITY_DN18295_c0_g1_i1.p1 TRINITY_DN18295_c0_g1~~TRINITY_DN18295_c0_g1_i1.p1  ORF type:complete len:291 (-),score=54.38 TRINITY_DN18295_c0_g1_i1:279-1151(-)
MSWLPLLLLLTAAWATSIRIFPGTAPDERQGTIGPESHNPGPGGDADEMYTNVTVPTLTPFLVPNATSAVIVAPGGGYTNLAIGREGWDIAAWLNSIGVSAFVLKYRVPARSWLPFGGAALMDAQRAMGLVRQMAGSKQLPRLNASRIGFMGFSAGGHLTGHISTSWQTRSYPKLDHADDLSCRPDFAIMIYPWEVVQADLHTTSLNVTSQTPVTFLAQAEDDPVHVENSLFYWLALKQHKAPPSELHLYPRGGHGYGRCTVAPVSWAEVCTWPDRAALFLQVLGVAPKK